MSASTSPTFSTSPRRAIAPAYLTKGQTLSTSERNAMALFGLTPLLGNAPARPNTDPVTRANWQRLNESYTAAQRKDGDGNNPQAVNPPLYYALMAVPYRVAVAAGGDAFDQMALVRLGNVPIFLAGLVFVWLLAAELFGGTFLPTVATAAVAVFPKLTSLVGNVSTETLLFTCFAAAMYASVRAIRHGPTIRNVALLAGAAIAAAMTQGRGLAVAPAAILALLLALLRHRPPRRRTLELCGLFGGALAAGLVLLSVTGGGLGGGTSSAFGGAVSGSIHGAFNIGDLISNTWQFYLPKLPGMSPRIGPDYGYRQVYIESFFSSLFNAEVVVRKVIFDLIQLSVAIGLVWLVGALVARRRAVAAWWQIVVALAGFLVAELAVLHVNSYQQLLANNGTDPIITGRYLVPLLALAGATVAFCISALPRRARAPAAGIVLGALVALQLSELGLSIARFYG